MTDRIVKKERIITKNFCCTFMAQMSMALVMYMLITTIAEYVTAFGVTATIGGMVSGIYVFGGLFSRICSGTLMGRFGWKRIALIFLILHFVACGFYFVTHSIGLLLLIRFIHGLGFGASANAIMVIGMSSLPRSRYGEATGYFMLSTSLGIAIGPFFGGLIYDSFGGPGSFTAALILSLIALICIAAVNTRDIDPYHISRRTNGGKKKSAEAHAPAAAKAEKSDADEKAVGKEAAKGGYAEAHPKEHSKAHPPEHSKAYPEAHPPEHSKAHPKENPPEHSKAYPKEHPREHPKAHPRGFSRFFEKSTVPVAMCILFLSVGYASLLSFYRMYAASLDMTKEFSGFFLIYAVVLLVSRPAAGVVQDRFGDGAVCYPCMVCQVLALVLLAWRPCMLTVVACAVGSALGYGTLNSSLNAIANRNVTNKRRSYAVATYWAFCDMGVGISPTILGAIVTAAGFHTMYFAAAAIAFLAIPVYWFASKKRAELY